MTAVTTDQVLKYLFSSSSAKYTSGAVANWYLKKAAESKQTITPMKLQKLLYFSHGWSLAKNKTPLINEPAEAWEYGPVFPSVYHEYKKFGNHAIPNSSGSFMQELQKGGNGTLHFSVNQIDASDSQTIGLLEDVWNNYSSFSGMELSDMTHRVHSQNPWQIIHDKAVEHNMRSADIPNTLIQEYFEFLQQNHLTY